MPDGSKITNVPDALSIAPEGCALIVPDPATSKKYPGVFIILPIFRTDLSTPCVAGAATVGNTIGCASGWVYADGTPVPDTVGAPPAFWQNGDPKPNDVVASIFPDTGQAWSFTFDIARKGEFFAIYECCLPELVTCPLGLTEPATPFPAAASSSSSSKMSMSKTRSSR